MKTIGIRAALKKIGATDIEVRTGHLDKSGFFNLPGRGLMYFSFSRPMHCRGAVMVRTAQSRKDYRGGTNEWWFDEKLAELGYRVNLGELRSLNRG